MSTATCPGTGKRGEYLFGRLLDFPTTATDAWLESKRGNAKALQGNEEQNDLIMQLYGDKDFACFVFFRLSRAHASEELKMVKRWYDLLKKYDFIESRSNSRAQREVEKDEWPITTM